MNPEETPKSIPTSEFKLDDPRQNAVYDYLKRLVGEGAASFYKDACRHMATRPPFESTTHIVAHLLREIESALRAVLESITEEAAPAGGDKHRKQIEIILKALGFEEQDPVAQAWLKLPGEDGLQGMAHRRNLDPARPIDDEFIDRWNNLNSVLLAVLERFETQYIKVFQNLDKLAAKTVPTQGDVDNIKLHTPNNHVAHERFFNAISSPAWLPLLESSGFFKLPPPPEQDTENNGVRHMTWPIISYLSKVAGASPDLVAKILSEIPDSENGNVKAGMIEVTTKLPKEKKIELMPHIKRWMTSGGQFFTSRNSAELIKSLNADNETAAALSLTGVFLDLAPNPPKDENKYSFRDPRPFIDPWQYARFLDDDFPAIAKADPASAISLLCELLGKFYDLDREGKEEDPNVDYSYISRPSIEEAERLGRDDVDDALIDAILTVSEQAISADATFLITILSALGKHKRPVFKRIALYLLSKHPDINPDITTANLMDTSLFDDSNFDHEYSLLAHSAAKTLSSDQKKTIFGFIEEAAGYKERIRNAYEPIAEDRAERMVKMWQRDRLSIFESILEGEMKSKYDQLVSDLGNADNPRTRERMGVFVGPVSHMNADSISKMSADELVNLMKTWTPPETSHGFGASKEGLGRELNAAVKRDVGRFSAFAMSFAGLDPTYVRSYLQGFSEVVQNHILFDWTPVIDLCLWVIDQPREIPGRKGDDDSWGDEDPHWGWTRRAVITLISNGLNNNAIPMELHEKVWRIIEVLSDDPNPTPQQELTREGTLVDDAYNLTINTVRGEALTAVVEYGLWMTRLIEKIPEEKRPVLKEFAVFPHVREILEKHLSDPSIAVRAVYGRYLPWILLLGRKWTIAHLKDIFPQGQFGTPLYDAAWETYIGYVGAYGDVLEVLHDQYAEAITNIGTGEKKKNHRQDRDARLVEHLMTFFWRGHLDIADPDGLFTMFWKKADEDSKAHAIDFLGRSLHSLTDPVDDEVAKRLKDIWEMRIGEAEAAADKKPYEKEMSGFGWWFASGKMDEDWSIRQFIRSLEISKKVNGDYSVIDRLVVLVQSKPIQAIQILEKLIQRDRQQWVLFGSETDLRNILAATLNSPEKPAQDSARALINRLVAWGYTSYGNLLLPPPPPEPSTEQPSSDI